MAVIVERLRDEARICGRLTCMWEAAAEIERLKTVIDRAASDCDFNATLADGHPQQQLWDQLKHKLREALA